MGTAAPKIYFLLIGPAALATVVLTRRR